ncbi:hypothetical protein PFDG_04843 [Plasmodium falciparum Dd2]|uniref:Uncharacterized protein n=1 Tax=Plasmodium falciparum (isolate Dd2) TaxID=57267 RepID=A0A0L7M9Q2_PLAF4|nr:hypothetical protein PFDG_04843 [Plasmodium falciparum Dd2]
MNSNPKTSEKKEPWAVEKISDPIPPKYLKRLSRSLHRLPGNPLSKNLCSLKN